MPVFRRDDMTPFSGSSYPAPFNEGMGNYRAWAFSNAAVNANNSSCFCVK